MSKWPKKKIVRIAKRRIEQRGHCENECFKHEFIKFGWNNAIDACTQALKETQWPEEEKDPMDRNDLYYQGQADGFNRCRAEFLAKIKELTEGK